MLLSEFAKFYHQLDIDANWKNIEVFKSVCLTTDGDDFDYTTSGNDRSGGSRKRGVYRHIAKIDGEDMILYIGKAEGTSSSIAQRQTRHLHAYKNINFTGEMSGKKYRQFMQDYQYSELFIRIEYVDMTDFPPAMIAMFERMSIDHFMPLINQ